MHRFTWILLALALTTFGCTKDNDATQGTINPEPSLPRVEVGDQPIDMDPKTDGDVDIDTPKPGDT